MEDAHNIHRSDTEMSSIPYDTLKLIVQQIPQTRELLQLFIQLYQALPINSFEVLENSCEEGMIRFRDMRLPVRLLKDLIPAFIFPINDETTLIERLSHVVRVIPAFVGFDSSKVENIQYIAQANLLSLYQDWLKAFSIPVSEYVVRNQDK